MDTAGAPAAHAAAASPQTNTAQEADELEESDSGHQQDEREHSIKSDHLEEFA